MTSPLTMELIVPFIRATEEYFRDTLLLEIRPVSIAIQPDHLRTQAVSGIIGLAGIHRGVCSVHMTSELADTVTRIIHVCPEGEIVARQSRSQAMAAILSDIAGRVSLQLAETPHHFVPTLPGIIQGGEPLMFYPPDTPCVVIDYRIGGTRFTMDIRIATV